MNKEKVLLKYLKRISDRYSTSKELSKYMNVSTRTIRNYIRRINERTPGLILSNSQGYKINSEKNIENYHENSIENQRKIYILRRLIKNIDRGLDLFDLADSLYISESTLKSTINYINKEIKQWSLSIKTRGNKIYIVGNQYAIRHLLMNLLNQSSVENFDLSTEIQEILGSDIKLDDLYKIVLKYLDPKMANSYFLKDFVFHISIALDRAQKKIFDQKEIQSSTVEQIINEIQAEYSLYFLNEDLIEVEELFEQIYFNTSGTSIMHDKEFIEDINDALHNLENVYGITFENKDFKNRIYIHIDNLYKRAKQKNFSRNLSFEKIKTKYPILFDIAVFLASSLEQKLRIEINDDEIAFLALHIGAFLKEEPSSTKKLKTAIVTPGYLDEGEKIALQIKKEFSEDLVVTEILDISVFNKVNDCFDLIITNISMSNLWQERPFDVKQVVVHDKILPIEKIEIWETIREIKSTYFIQELKEILNKIIKENNFITNYEGDNYTQALDDISKILVTNHSVDKNYFEQLLEREEASYTSFPSGIAIPHTLKMDAMKTDIVILIPKNVIPWGDNKVKLVVGLSININDRKIFNKIFQRFVEVASETETIFKLSEQKDLETFLNILIETMAENNYYQ